jgi:hypothetical protein
VSTASAARNGRQTSRVSAIAELNHARRSHELAPRGRELPLPPGSLPLEQARSVVRSYRAGVAGADRVLAAIDTHAAALEIEISRKAVHDMADFQRGVRRLQILAEQISMRAQQAEWLRRFPAAAPAPQPLLVRLGRKQIAVPVALILTGLREIELDERLVATGAKPKPRRRGRSRAMSALADAGVTSADVALELGVEASRGWKILNGHQPAPAELPSVLRRLLGADQAEVVIAGIPRLPRAHAPASAAIAALHRAGATCDDVGALIPVQPGTVSRWLRGKNPPSPKLAAALEQLVGDAATARILALIPARTRVRAPASPALKALHAAGVNSGAVGSLVGVDAGTIRKWLRGSARRSPQLAVALEQVADATIAAQILALIPPRAPVISNR